MSVTKLVVCVCGGGNAAHVMAGLAASHHQTEARILTLFQDEAKRWSDILQEHGGLTIQKRNNDNSVVKIKSKPSIVSKEASEVIPGSNFIIFCVPAFAHEQYFTAIKEFLEPNTAIIGLPGQPGFEFQCFHILGDTARKCSILSYESLPWACRIVEFGRLVEILGVKDSLLGSVVRGLSRMTLDPVQALQSIVGDSPVLTLASNFVEPYLTTKSIIHPPVMFSRWKDWDGQALDEQPLFYQGIDEAGAECLSRVSQEVVDTARAISQQKPELNVSNVKTLLDCFRQDYRQTVADPTSLYTAMRSNSAYSGLLHPMKQTDDGKFLPDFKYRYLTEDIPFGLVVTKGLALLAGVPTPETDRVLTWCQKQIGKQFIVGTELKGRDVPSSRAPQAYGFNSLDDLVKLL